MVNIRGDCRDKYHGCYLRFVSSMIARTSYVLFCKLKQPVRTHTYLTHPKYHQESISFSFIQHFACSVTQRGQNFTANLFSSTIPSSYLFFVDAFISKIKSEADQGHFLGEGAPLRNDRTDVYYGKKEGLKLKLQGQTTIFLAFYTNS